MNTINDFYTDVLSLELGQFPVPEVTQVVECNEEAMGRYGIPLRKREVLS